MAWTRTIGRRIGGLSSAGVVGGAYAAVGLVALFDVRLAETGALAAMAVVFAYGWLRPTRRGSVLRSACIPAWIADPLHRTFGWPWWPVVTPLVVAVVVALVYEDRAEQREAKA